MLVVCFLSFSISFPLLQDGFWSVRSAVLSLSSRHMVAFAAVLLLTPFLPSSSVLCCCLGYGFAVVIQQRYAEYYDWTGDVYCTCISTTFQAVPGQW